MKVLQLYNTGSSLATHTNSNSHPHIRTLIKLLTFCCDFRCLPLMSFSFFFAPQQHQHSSPLHFPCICACLRVCVCSSFVKTCFLVSFWNCCLYFPLSPACFISSRNLFQITICPPSFNLIFPTFEICKAGNAERGSPKKEMSFPAVCRSSFFFH